MCAHPLRNPRPSRAPMRVHRTGVAHTAVCERCVRAHVRPPHAPSKCSMFRAVSPSCRVDACAAIGAAPGPAPICTRIGAPCAPREARVCGRRRQVWKVVLWKAFRMGPDSGCSVHRGRGTSPPSPSLSIFLSFARSWSVWGQSCMTEVGPTFVGSRRRWTNSAKVGRSPGKVGQTRTKVGRTPGRCWSILGNVW